MTARERGWLYSGLFLTTLATLMLEVLDSRLLSVLTWYHLAYLSVSVAMLGMSGGAMFVFLSGDRFDEETARRALPRYGLGLALGIALSHVVNLSVPVAIVRSLAPMEITSLAVTTLVLTAPFFLSGVVVTIALTRVGARIGLLYGFDLLGAAAGCLLVVVLMNHWDISSSAFATAAVAAGGACCFANLSGPGRRMGVPVMVLVVLLGGSLWNATSDPRVGVRFAKEKSLHPGWVMASWWNTHSYVMARYPQRGGPSYWGSGKGAGGVIVETTALLIDADAGTVMTQWDGDVESLGWVQYGITSLPYHLRRRGDVAVIGVGGGRDILTALWARSTSITAIEVNGILVDLLRGQARSYARIADRDDVQLVHDEARSYLSRTQERFDVIQMSLTDTWAATGAGAFTLSENGLYTLEAWRVFFDRLKPGGILNVSRWFAPDDISETSRLLALAVAALLERGVEDPSSHVALLSVGSVATLIVSTTPFSPQDVEKIREVASRYEFAVQVIPGSDSPNERLRSIAASRTRAQLEDATADPSYDYSPPTDDRPYFFNILKPASFLRVAEIEGFGVGGVLVGNSRATSTLVALFGIASALVTGIILLPLLRAGRPAMGPATFSWSIAYFTLIGLGFMFVQVPLLQRFTVYLGHPTLTFSVILFSMILFSGLGSLMSDRLRIERHTWHAGIPIGVAASLTVLIVVLQPVFDTTLPFGLPVRGLVTIGLIAPSSFLAGFCFPFGMRMVSRVSQDATAWMWGVNGACSVLASILAVGISLWAGIHSSLLLAAALYLALAGVAWRLERATRQPGRDGYEQTDAQGARSDA